MNKYIINKHNIIKTTIIIFILILTLLMLIIYYNFDYSDFINSLNIFNIELFDVKDKYNTIKTYNEEPATTNLNNNITKMQNIIDLKNNNFINKFKDHINNL